MAIPESIETFLLRLGFDYSTLHPDATATARPEGAEWVQTLAFIGGHTPILAVVPADCRVDTDRLDRIAGLGRLRPATSDELAALYPESEPGAMPPLGPLYGQPVFVDEGVARHDHVIFSAGTKTDAIRMRYGDFMELIHPQPGRFALPAKAHASFPRRRDLR